MEGAGGWIGVGAGGRTGVILKVYWPVRVMGDANGGASMSNSIRVGSAAEVVCSFSRMLSAVMRRPVPS